MCCVWHNPEEIKVHFHLEICFCALEIRVVISHRGGCPLWQSCPDLLCCWCNVNSLFCAKTSPLLVVHISDPKQRILGYSVHVMHLLSFEQDEAVLSDRIYRWPFNESRHHLITVKMKCIGGKYEMH